MKTIRYVFYKVVRLKHFSGFTFIRDAQSQLFESQRCTKTETLIEA